MNTGDTNLLHETIDFLAWAGLRPEDVMLIVSNQGTADWQHFSALAADFNYDSGYGREYVDLTLTLIGRDWWATRHSYDGSESWQMHKYPTIVPNTNSMTSLAEDDR